MYKEIRKYQKQIVIILDVCVIFILIMKYQFEQRPSDLNTRARANFVQKVYTILSIQLSVTALFVLLNIYSTTFAYIQYAYTSLTWVMIAIAIVSLIALSTSSFIQCHRQGYAKLILQTSFSSEPLHWPSPTWSPAFVGCIHLKACCYLLLQLLLLLSVLPSMQWLANQISQSG